MVVTDLMDKEVTRVSQDWYHLQDLRVHQAIPAAMEIRATVGSLESRAVKVSKANGANKAWQDCQDWRDLVAHQAHAEKSV